MPNEPADSSIFTLDAREGGVPALARTVYSVLERTGHTPTLVYRATEMMAYQDRWRIARLAATTPPVRRTQRDGLRVCEVVAYPMVPRRQYHTLRLARAEVRAPLAAIVSGSSHVGLARALSGRPYLMWVATRYDDEVRARAEGGDAEASALLNGPDWRALERQEALVYERAHAILAISPYTRERILEKWPLLGDKIRVVWPAIDTDRFYPASPAHDPPYLLFVARIRDPRKNARLLVRAAARARRAHPALRVIIAGDAPSSDLRALAREYGVEDATMFPGHVDRDTLVALYQRATLFVLPSTQEGLGMAAQEAMACGVPVIATRCGGPEGLIDHGINGWLVPNRDEEALAAAIVALLDDPGRRQAMGVAARARALAFSRPHVERELHRAFEDVFGTAFAANPAARRSR